MQQLSTSGSVPLAASPPRAVAKPEQPSLLSRLRTLLPTGEPLPAEAWESRHRVMIWLVWLHALSIPVLNALRHWHTGYFTDLDPSGQTFGRSIVEAGIVALFAVLAGFPVFGQRGRAVLATLGLLTTSAALVHIFDGHIELHFHYFVIVAAVSLYQDWTPFLAAIGYVALQHGVFGLIDPTAVYQHHSGQQHPWRWAAVHAGFILAESAALLTGWRLIEQEAARRRAALEETNHALQEANRLKGEFLSTMSHELRAPMNSILGYGHLLLDGVAGDLTPEQAGDVAQITDSAETLLRLIDNVLDLSKIEAGRLDVAPEAIDLARLVAQVRSHFVLEAGEKNVALLVDIPADIPPVWADSEHLRQILTNLIGNAVKFTDRGRVTIAARATAAEIRLAVNDTGVGIPLSATEFIFEAFRQADSSLTRRFGGTGLGLSIARRLAELQGGRIEVSSQVGVGSTFTLTLPVAKVSDAPAAEAPDSGGRPKSSTDWTQQRQSTIADPWGLHREPAGTLVGVGSDREPASSQSQNGRGHSGDYPAWRS